MNPNKEVLFSPSFSQPLNFGGVARTSLLEYHNRAGRERKLLSLSDAVKVKEGGRLPDWRVENPL